MNQMSDNTAPAGKADTAIRKRIVAAVSKAMEGARTANEPSGQFLGVVFSLGDKLYGDAKRVLASGGDVEAYLDCLDSVAASVRGSRAPQETIEIFANNIAGAVTQTFAFISGSSTTLGADIASGFRATPPDAKST